MIAYRGAACSSLAWARARRRSRPWRGRPLPRPRPARRESTADPAGTGRRAAADAAGAGCRGGHARRARHRRHQPATRRSSRCSSDSTLAELDARRAAGAERERRDPSRSTRRGSSRSRDTADERGTAEYNLALGERRALAARNYLVSLGIPADRLRTVSYGKEFPFDPGHDEAAWSKNRRAHFVVTSK